MIIKKFQEQAAATPANIAINTGNRTITYSELNAYGNQLADAIITYDDNGGGNSEHQGVSLLFEHGADMIVAVIGTLIAGKTYVPMDINYPEKRLAYMLEDSNSYLILTNSANFSLARRLTGQISHKADIINIDSMDMRAASTANMQRKVPDDGDRLAYILYTSGSTGRPKGVVQTHRNVLYYTRNWIERFSITQSDRMTLITAFSHDGAVQDIFSALLSGACLYPYNIKSASSTYQLYSLLMGEKITIWHSVPSVFRFFANSLTLKDHFYDMRWILLGGEPLRAHDLELYNTHFPKALLANVYGQTESSVSTICVISPKAVFDDISLGEPLNETRLLVVDEEGDLVEKMGVGEVAVACDYLAPGYWQDQEKTDGVFTHDEELGRLYWTGDLGRLTAAGTIKMMGRKDFQVKVRGFRVETGEIETRLLQHPGVDETVTIAKEDKDGDNYLCAYLVSPEPISSSLLREYLAEELPDYMIPRYFIPLEQMPVTPNGKIDKKRLPEPEEIMIAHVQYESPGNEVEEKIAAIWQEVLGLEKVGINDNFMDMGGHSLLVISIISKIHKALDVELQLRDVFDNPTIKQLARLVKVSNQSIFSSILPSEAKEYHMATPEQTRMYIMNQFEGNIAYNLSIVYKIEASLDPRVIETIFRSLIQRHEGLRTSFKMMADQLVQVIHETIDFHLRYIQAQGQNEEGIANIIKEFIEPFDLSKAPLLRVGLVKLSERSCLLLLDIHHITSDGVSLGILMKDFFRLYTGEPLPQLKLKYKDYSQWENSLFDAGQMENQENYWLNQFKGDIPILELPINYPRPEVQDFSGDIVIFILDSQVSQQVKQLAKETGTTLFVVLLAMYNVLLHKYSQQEDIVIGSIIAGRNHVDLENIVGLFVKTLALRNYPAGNKTFLQFLLEVKETTLGAFQNQMYPLDRLVEKLNLKKDPARNPLFDAAFLLQASEMTLAHKEEKDMGITAKLGYNEKKTTKFDLTFEALEKGEEIYCSFEYSTKLFKTKTIELLKERFVTLIEQILDDREMRIEDLDYSIPVEKELKKNRELEFEF